MPNPIGNRSRGLGPAGRPPPSSYAYKVPAVSSFSHEVNGSIRTSFPAPAGDSRCAHRQSDMLVFASPRQVTKSEVVQGARTRNESFSTPAALSRCPSWDATQTTATPSGRCDSFTPRATCGDQYATPRGRSHEMLGTRSASFSPRVASASPMRSSLSPGPLVRCNSARLAQMNYNVQRSSSFDSGSRRQAVPAQMIRSQSMRMARSQSMQMVRSQSMQMVRNQSMSLASANARSESTRSRSQSFDRSSSFLGSPASGPTLSNGIADMSLQGRRAHRDSFASQISPGSARQLSARQLHRDSSCCEAERLERMRMAREFNMQRLRQAIDLKRRAVGRLQASPGVSIEPQPRRIQTRDQFDPRSLGLTGKWSVQDEIVFQQPRGDESSSDESDNPTDCLPATATFVIRALSPVRDRKSRAESPS